MKPINVPVFSYDAYIQDRCLECGWIMKVPPINDALFRLYIVDNYDCQYRNKRIWFDLILFYLLTICIQIHYYMDSDFYNNNNMINKSQCDRHGGFKIVNWIIWLFCSNFRLNHLNTSVAYHSIYNIINCTDLQQSELVRPLYSTCTLWP